MAAGAIDRLWYGKGRPLWFLWPLAWLFGWISKRRRARYASGHYAIERVSAPVVVVGNITVGGTGKSPLVLAIVEHLRQKGWRPVIISRGYGGKSDVYPLVVTDKAPASVCGDEPKMLALQSQVPVVVDPRRARAASMVCEKNLGDILVCDDGLQHYALGRDVEIAVFDGLRGLGNGALMPVGPLREPPERLRQVDAIVCNGETDHRIAPGRTSTMLVRPTKLRNLVNTATHELEWLRNQSVVAVAGIGHPARFFTTLTDLGAVLEPDNQRPLSDHHNFTAADLRHDPEQPLVMTAKDAVKCAGIGEENCWVLEVSACLPDAFWSDFDNRLAATESS